MRTRDSISLGWCDPGHVDGEFAVAIALLAAARTARLGPVVRVEGSALVSKLRNEIVATFLDRSPCQWLLMIDSDQILTVAAFDQLLSAAHDEDRPIVAGLCFAGFLGGDLYPIPVPAIYRETDGVWSAIDDYPPNQVIGVDAAGTGCLLIHRRVLEHMRDLASPDEGRDWCWFADGPVGGQWVGEDVIFSRRVTQLGYPIHAHTGAVLPHRKRYWLSAPHHDRILELRRQASGKE